MPVEPRKAGPGEGIRSMRSTWAFRTLNFELYAKPSKSSFHLLSDFKLISIFCCLDVVIMGIGLVSITGVFGYIAYMRSKYEGLGYYAAVKNDGTEVFEKKKSRWEK